MMANWVNGKEILNYTVKKYLKITEAEVNLRNYESQILRDNSVIIAPVRARRWDGTKIY